MSRWFVEHDGSPQAAVDLEAWLRLTPANMGPRQAAHRVGVDWRAVRRFSALVLLLPALLIGMVAGGIVGLAVAGDHGMVSGGMAAAAMGVMVLMIGFLGAGATAAAAAATARSTRVDVHAHGLVVGTGAGRAIPFATMDPGRIVWITSPWAGRQIVTLGRRRLGVGENGLLISGTDGPSGVEDPQRLGTIYDPSPRAPKIATPFVWWYLGPEDPAAFLHDLEAALLIDGYPAHGLAARVRANPQSVPLRRTPSEMFPRRVPGQPVLWRPQG